jgi:hypothetical protein
MKKTFMETYNIKKDIQVFGIIVESFPNGIPEAYDKLQAMISPSANRTFYGISYLDKKGVMKYAATVNELEDGEGKKYGCESFTIPKGEYLYKTIPDWKDNIDSIKTTFPTLFKDPRVDYSAPCIEWYVNDKEMRCMVKIGTKESVAVK